MIGKMVGEIFDLGVGIGNGHAQAGGRRRDDEARELAPGGEGLFKAFFGIKVGCELEDHGGVGHGLPHGGAVRIGLQEGKFLKLEAGGGCGG